MRRGRERSDTRLPGPRSTQSSAASEDFKTLSRHTMLVLQDIPSTILSAAHIIFNDAHFLASGLDMYLWRPPFDDIGADLTALDLRLPHLNL
jgi:hypothetical protein